MREEIRLELQRKIAEKFESGLRKPGAAKPQISEEERRAKTAQYADMLIKAALKAGK